MTSHPTQARAIFFAAALASILSGCSGSDSAKPDGAQAAVKADAGTPDSGSTAATPPKATPDSTEMKGLDPTPPLSRTDMGNGLVIEELKIGTGDIVWPGSRVRLTVKGWSVATGKLYWDTANQGGPRDVALATAMAGMREGIPGMRVGGKRRLSIPAPKAYGFKEVKNEKDEIVVPLGTSIRLEVEVLEVLTRLNLEAPVNSADDPASGGPATPK